MAMLVKDRARQDAVDVLDATWALSTPVDPERIAESLGMVVRRIPLADGISGILRVEPGADPEIFINERDTPQRQRFTIAHELGHFYERLARGETDYNIVEHRGGKYDLHEFYADEFAGSLLMPERELRRMKDEGTNLAQLARHFDVSLVALRKRLERLEL